MKKTVSCFDCGNKYDRKKEARCVRCGEEKIFNPLLHDENYDIAKDPVALLKYRLVGIGLFLVLLIYTMNITH